MTRYPDRPASREHPQDDTAEAKQCVSTNWKMGIPLKLNVLTIMMSLENALLSLLLPDGAFRLALRFPSMQKKLNKTL